MSTRDTMISEIVQAALAHSGIKTLAGTPLSFPLWDSLTDHHISMLHSTASSRGLNADTLDSIKTILRFNADTLRRRDVFLANIAANLDRIWSETHDKPYADVPRLPDCILFLPWFTEQLPDGEELTEDEICVFLLMMRFVPGGEQFEAFHNDIHRFVKTFSIADAHRALQLQHDGGATRIMEAETMLLTGNAPMAKGAL